jgi:hypothetical protein
MRYKGGIYFYTQQSIQHSITSLFVFTSLLTSINLPKNDFIIIIIIIIIIYHYKLQRLLIKTIVILNKNLCKIATKIIIIQNEPKSEQHTYTKNLHKKVNL